MEKDLNYWKKNAEEDYMKVPISVLRYITELEKIALPQADVIKSVYGQETVEQTINRISQDITDWKPFPNEPKTVL